MKPDPWWFFNVYTFIGAIAFAVAFPPFWLVIIGSAIWIYSDIKSSNKKGKDIAEKIKLENDRNRVEREKIISTLKTRINDGDNKSVYKLAELYSNENSKELALEYYEVAIKKEKNNRNHDIATLSDFEYFRSCMKISESLKQKYFKEIECLRVKEKIYECLLWLEEAKSLKIDSVDINDIISDVKYEIKKIENKIEEEKRIIEKRKTEWNTEFLDLLSKNTSVNLEAMLPYKNIFELCESEPEAILLQDFICFFGFKATSDIVLKNKNIEVRSQVHILDYRVDFLLNDKLIIEVDGRSYHDNEYSFEYDKYRDQSLMAYGYKVVRLPAVQIYKECRDATEKIFQILQH